jgi:tungstate transport system substrate-binding protein
MKHIIKLLFITITLFIISCSNIIKASNTTNKFLLIASTIGPVDAGIIGVLEEAYEKETGIRVRHVAAGSGEALKIAQKGQIDLVITHTKKLEEKFISEGFGTARIPLMYNEFAIVGPKNDTAGIRGMKKASDALKAIAGKNVLFISRGDNSGTHVAEMNLWAAAGIKPKGNWYAKYAKGPAGNAPTLLYTDKMKAYTVIDKATYYLLKNKIKLDVLVEKDKDLLNYMTVIPVSQKKFASVNHAGAVAFARWLTNPEKGQRIISEFKKGKYQEPLFYPDSDEYRNSKK